MVPRYRVEVDTCLGGTTCGASQHRTTRSTRNLDDLDAGLPTTYLEHEAKHCVELITDALLEYLPNQMWIGRIHL